MILEIIFKKLLNLSSFFFWQGGNCFSPGDPPGGGAAQFRSAMRAGWLKYLKDTYAALQEEGAIGPSIGQGKMVVDDE